MRNIVIALLASLSVGLVGCGGESPMPPNPDTDGHVADVNTPVDAGPADVQIAPDNGATDAGVGNDATPPTDGGETLCVPTYVNESRTITCAGYLCQPNAVNPTCEAAASCDCNMRAEQMPATVCTATTMPACTGAVHCSPGRNHCSVNLPAGTDLTTDRPFPFLDPDHNGRGGLRRTILENWISDDGTITDRFAQLRPLTNERGFTQVCFVLPDESVIPVSFQGTVVCAECAGRTCYWNRSGLMNGAPAAEIEFGENSSACSYSMRVYANSATAAAVTHRMISGSTLCN